MEAPEHHAHGGHTGIRWVDISLALSALFVSLVSLWLALQHGHDMTKLVEANSLPYVEMYPSDMHMDRKTPAFVLTVSNAGVGPARIAEVTVTVDGKAVPNLKTLSERCCGVPPEGTAGTDADPDFISSTLRDRMIRPGQTLDAIDWLKTPTNQSKVDRMRQGFASGRINATVCYCSVFEECWTRSFHDRRPTPVHSCPVAPTPYRQ